MTKEEMFDWIVENNAQILRSPKMLWTREDGSTFYSNFTLSSGNTQWSAAETLEEAIEFAKNFQDNA